MAAEPTTRTFAVEHSLAEDHGEETFERVCGEIVRTSPPSPEHGLFCATLARILVSDVLR